MGSFKLPWSFDNWFSKPPPPPSYRPPLPFASLNVRERRHRLKPPSCPRSPDDSYIRMLEQAFWEAETRPDHRHTPEVERILANEPILAPRDDATPEEIEDNRLWWEDLRQSPFVEFLKKAQEYSDSTFEKAVRDNGEPHWKDVRKLWKKLPQITGPDGRPMVRRALKTRREVEKKFWDFTKQFLFGLWDFRQRAYPPGKPLDGAQAIGYDRLERRYYDFIMRSGGFFYKDRLGRTRGPMELIQLKTAWAAGIIDTHTFVWGEDMDEWAPIGMVYGMEKAIATWEVRLGAAATAALLKLQKGIPLWTPMPGFEKKTYKQLQDESIDDKRRDMAVLNSNNGIWPGVKIPSHALFLWASGTELTNLLEEDTMPNKFIPKDLRYRLAEAIPGLRPWQVRSVEQAMNKITYHGKWYREGFGSFTTGPPYVDDENDIMEDWFNAMWKFDCRIQKLVKRLYGYALFRRMGDLWKDVVERKALRNSYITLSILETTEEKEAERLARMKKQGVPWEE